MLSNEQIRCESKSRIYLSQRTEEEKDRLEKEILDCFSKPNGKFEEEKMDDLYLLIRKLIDCAYIRCSIDSNLRVTYKTTDSGKARLKVLRNVVNR